MPSATPSSAYSLKVARAHLEEFLGEEIGKDVDLDIEDEWYRTGEKDFSLYSGEEYLRYLLKAHDYSRRCVATAVFFMKEYMKYEPKRFLDCGTGLGFFAALIATEFPNCEVVATNLPSRQFDFNTWLFAKLGLPNLSLVHETEARGDFDTIMVMEGFEHYPQPDAELRRLVEAHNPEVLVESSSFSRRGLGHFSEYTIGGVVYSEREHQQTGKKGAGPAFRQFTKVVKATGFQRVPLEMRGWSHSRPRIWKRAPVERTPLEKMFDL